MHNQKHSMPFICWQLWHISIMQTKQPRNHFKHLIMFIEHISNQTLYYTAKICPQDDILAQTHHHGSHYAYSKYLHTQHHKKTMQSILVHCTESRMFLMFAGHINTALWLTRSHCNQQRVTHNCSPAFNLERKIKYLDGKAQSQYSMSWLDMGLYFQIRGSQWKHITPQEHESTSRSETQWHPVT